MTGFRPPRRSCPSPPRRGPWPSGPPCAPPRSRPRLSGAGSAEGRCGAAPPPLPSPRPQGAVACRAALRAPLLQTEDFRRRLGEGALTLDGWTHTDEAVIEAQGGLTGLWGGAALRRR